jgi:aspartyl-tRNA(Asn)/glutamyl-tRNA(Gln) amidotransferase subunit A
VKDNIYAAGLPASWGSLAYRGFRPTADEPVIARLRAHGAVVLGKTNIPEFTVQGFTSNAVFGTAFNPLAPGRTPGGSTGGGAAAVAAGLGPLAIGTDGGGSLRRPAAHCGLFALKPSIGEIPRLGGFRQILADFEVIGPIARTLADVAIAFTSMRGADPLDPRSRAAAAPSKAIPAKARVGYFSRIGDAPVDGRITTVADGFAAKLAASGLVVESIPVPFDAALAGEVWGTIAAVGLAWELKRLGDRAADIGDNARQMADRGANIAAAQYLDALAAVADVRAAAARLFERFDFLLCPTAAALAWPADEAFPPTIDGRPVGPRGHAIFTGWMNVAGLPAANLPIGLTPDAGGIGVQIVGPHGSDRALLDFLLNLEPVASLCAAPFARK